MRLRIEDSRSSLVDLSGAGGTPRAGSTNPRSLPPSPEAAPSEAPAAAPPVFYRPPAAGFSSGGARPVCGDLGRFPVSRRVVFPLEERYFYSYEDTWGAPRPQGGHEGTDLMAPEGAPEYAVTDGTVVLVAGSNENGWNTLGGYAVMVRADYSIGPVKAGDLFYYAHLVRPSPLKAGTRVRAGQVVGYSGDTGQGPEVTRGLFPAHLHLGWYDPTGARSEADSGAMNPYPLLEWIKANVGAVTGGSGARYCEAPSPIPPTGESDWPTPDAPGVSPDLDTDSGDPKPSPVARNEPPTTTAPVRRAAPAKRATPERPARALQDHTPQREDPRGIPARSPKTERPPKSPKPPAAGPPKTEPPLTKPSRPEPSKPGAPSSAKPPSPKPSQKRPVSDEGAPRSPEPPNVPRDEPALQDLPIQDLIETLIPTPDREPADTLNHDRPDDDRREEKPEDGGDQQQTGQDDEEKPVANEPDRRPNPTAGQDPAEGEPSPPNLETDDPEEPDEPEPETTEPETTEPVLETTVEPETTVE